MKKFSLLFCALALVLPLRAASLSVEIQNFIKALEVGEAGQAHPDPTMRDITPQLLALGVTPGGEAQLEMEVRQLIATHPDDAVQKTGQVLLQALEAQEDARVEAVKAQIDPALAHAAEAIATAQKAEDLDGILTELQKLTASPNRTYYDPREQIQTDRIGAAYRFVAGWQDYIAARNNGKRQEAEQDLRNLANQESPGDPLLIPRSQILARIAELDKSSTSATAENPQVRQADDEASILNDIKTLDDMEPALRELLATSPNQNPSPTIQEFRQMVTLYADFREGLPVSLDQLNLSGRAYDPGGAPELARIKAMLAFALLLPYLGNEAPAVNPGENLTAYLDRALHASVDAQNWPETLKVLDARKTFTPLNASSGGPSFFIDGLYQEMGGQYVQAVSSYHAALLNPDTSIPAKLVSDRLAAIQRDHPDAFDQGMRVGTPTGMSDLGARLLVNLPNGFTKKPAAPTTSASTNAPSATVHAATNAASDAH